MRLIPGLAPYNARLRQLSPVKEGSTTAITVSTPCSSRGQALHAGLEIRDDKFIVFGAKFIISSRANTSIVQAQPARAHLFCRPPLKRLPFLQIYSSGMSVNAILSLFSQLGSPRIPVGSPRGKSSQRALASLPNPNIYGGRV